ncbi:MAG: hypothetical protein LBI82_02240 [Dysgonamonadaceae bacterium]|jgi:hypothetical protein|nr:hypothetical protein [Dysgonamonadaceae bacterium]
MEEKFNKQILDFCFDNSYHIHFDMMLDSDFFRQPSDKNISWFKSNIDKLISFSHHIEEYTNMNGKKVKIILVELEYREKSITQLVLFKMLHLHYPRFEELIGI